MLKKASRKTQDRRQLKAALKNSKDKWAGRLASDPVNDSIPGLEKAEEDHEYNPELFLNLFLAAIPGQKDHAVKWSNTIQAVRAVFG